MKKTALALAVCLLALFFAAPALADDIERQYRVRSLDMVVDSATLRVNQERILWVQITPAYAEDQSITWTSSNPEVVMVDGDGTITGVSPGTAVITATSYNGKTATCTVTVPGTVLTGIEQNADSAALPSGIDGGEVLYAYKLRADVESAMQGAAAGGQAELTYRDKTTVSMSALRGAAFAAEYAGGTACLRFQTTDGDGGVQGQMTIYPARATEEDKNVKVAVYTQSAQALQAASAAASRFGTAAAGVQLTHSGSFGMSVEVAAAVDLGGMDAQALRLYGYDSVEGTFTPLDDQSYRTGDGYIYFNATQGGLIAIV